MLTRTSLRAAALRVAHRGGLSALARRAERQLTRLTGSTIRVMNLHGTPTRDAEAFREQVEWVARRFEFVSPQQFFAIARGDYAPPLRPAVMFTFDDGLKSNAEVAARVLESFGLRGLFFVCPGFSELEGEAAKRFFYSRVEPQTPPSQFAEDWTPLRAADVTALHQAGHTIGSHTWAHARLSEVAAAELPEQIDRAADAIEAWTGVSCAAFAWTFAWNAITAAAHQHALRRHAFVFGACPGTTRAGHIDPRLVFRTHVEAGWSVEEYAFFYSGLADPIWSPRRRQLRQLLGLRE